MKCRAVIFGVSVRDFDGKQQKWRLRNFGTEHTVGRKTRASVERLGVRRRAEQEGLGPRMESHPGEGKVW